MSFTPDIQLFTCHYTSQQTSGRDNKELEELGLPENIGFNRLTCTGKLKETQLLDAFEQGADAVYVVGCPLDKCHNEQGSKRAQKRVESVRAALGELGVEPDRARFYFSERGLHPEFVRAANEMNDNISKLGPSPFAGDKK